MNDATDREAVEARVRAGLPARYRLLAEVGLGGMAVVYRAHDEKLDRDVAIKVIRPEMATGVGTKRFLREIQLSAKLQHPSILALIDSGEADGLPYYVMPFVEGETLAERIAREQQLDIDEALRIARDVLSALHYAHSKGVIHRDIKPANILLLEERAVVADFGIAQAISSSGSERITQTGFSVGTASYMSPEQAGGGPLDGRSDLYSLACVLYEMLVGSPPFVGGSLQVILARHAADPVPPIRSVRPAVPKRIERAVAKALSKTPADRFKDAAKFQKALEAGATTSDARAKALRVLAYVPVAALVVLASYLVAYMGSGGFSRSAPGDAPAPEYRQVTFSGWVQGAEISPNGSEFAYVERDSTGVDHVLLKTIEGGPPLELGSWDVISLIGWDPTGSKLLVSRPSPDSEAVYLIPRLGGERRRILNYSIDYAAWSPDGNEFFDIGWFENNVNFLNRVNIATGEETVDTLEITGWETGLAASPDGRWLIAATADDSAGEHILWRVSTEDGSSLELRRDTVPLHVPVWPARTNTLYYLRGGLETQELWKLPMSADAVPEGPPRRLLTGLTVAAGEYQALDAISISADGSTLLYPRFSPRAELYEVENTAEPGIETQSRRLTTGTGYDTDPSVSPDGSRIAFSSGDGARSNIFVLDRRGGSVQQVTYLSGRNNSPVWSRDGTRIAFISVQDAQPELWIAEVASGSARSLVTSGLAHLTTGQLTWAPGERILYQKTGLRNFGVVDPITGEDVPFIENDSVGWIHTPRYSADGQQIAAYWYRDPQSGIWSIAARETAQQRWLAEGLWWQVLGWSQNGSLYLRRWGTSTLLEFSPSLATSGGTPLRLPEGGRLIELPQRRYQSIAVSPDGAFFVASARLANSDAWMVKYFDSEVVAAR